MQVSGHPAGGVGEGGLAGVCVVGRGLVEEGLKRSQGMNNRARAFAADVQAANPPPANRIFPSCRGRAGRPWLEAEAGG